MCRDARPQVEVVAVPRLFVGQDAVEQYQKVAEVADYNMTDWEIYYVDPLAVMARVVYEREPTEPEDPEEIDTTNALIKGNADEVFAELDRMVMEGVCFEILDMPAISSDGTVYQQIQEVHLLCDCPEDLPEGEQPCEHCLRRAQKEAAKAEQAAETKGCEHTCGTCACAEGEEAATEVPAADAPPAPGSNAAALAPRPEEPPTAEPEADVATAQDSGEEAQPPNDGTEPELPATAEPAPADDSEDTESEGGSAASAAAIEGEPTTDEEPGAGAEAAAQDAGDPAAAEQEPTVTLAAPPGGVPAPEAAEAQGNEPDSGEDDPAGTGHQ